MDKIQIIIDEIKNVFKPSDDQEKILKYIETKYEIDIIKTGLTTRDLEFLIELTVLNNNITTELLKDIFLTSKNKIQERVLVSVSDTNVPDIEKNNILDLQVIDIIRDVGIVLIKPKEVFLLWNNKNKNILVKDDANEGNIKIKLVNYSVFLDRETTFNNNDPFLTTITDDYMRNFGFEKTQGYKSHYHLLLSIENENTYTCINEAFLGDSTVYIGKEYYSLNLRIKKNIYTILGKMKTTLIELFSKKNKKLINYLKLFLTSESLFPHLDIIFDSIKKNKILIPKQKISNHVYVEEDIENNLAKQVFMTEECTHQEEYNKVYSSGDYFNMVNNFIKTYINYEDGRAICVLCNEIVKELNIQASFFIDKEKFITTPGDDILDFPPYNKFNNLFFFMDNLFYSFMFVTKMGVYNNVMVTRLLIDNLVFVSSKRIDLENKYKDDINNNNIFLLRLTNNFFEPFDLEKERFKEKRTMFTNLPAYLIIFVTSSLSDYYDFFFFKKKIKLDKINKNWSLITFEDIMSYIIDMIFKNTIIETNYTETKETQRIEKIKRSLRIYYEIFNEEFRLLYDEKKILVERYLKRLSGRELKYNIYTIGNFMDGIFATEFNNIGQYILNVKKIDMLRHKKEIEYYRNRNSLTADINTNVNVDIFNKKNFNIDKTFFDKDGRIFYLDLFEIEQRDPTKEELKTLDLVIREFENEKEYSYNKHNYKILQVEDFFILDSDKNKIQFTDKDILDIKSLNVYTNKDINANDVFLYIKDITVFHFEYIMRQFFISLEKKNNFIIKTNLLKFLKTNFKNRRDLFLLKIKILSTISKNL